MVAYTRARNGRTAAENRAYAEAAAAAIPHATLVANAARARNGYSVKLAAEIDPDGVLTPEELDREVRQAKRRQLAAARAKALTAKRQLREATERAALADTAFASAALADVAAFDDAG
jgi:hypothetical protein